MPLQAWLRQRAEANRRVTAKDGGAGTSDRARRGANGAEKGNGHLPEPTPAAPPAE
jgi:hypothetical protein